MPALSENYMNKLKHYWKRPTKSTNVTKWLDMKSRVMSKLLLGLTFGKGSKSPNESESLSLLLHSLAHLDDPTILT
jgi:hypothetical protein